ncbi:MAG: UDP-N-acetylglucosamine 1-carboxyvinyltransferase [Myxococcota bacterium]
MSEVFRIEGGHRLDGRIRPSGNKNAALPLICASVLSTETVQLENVPRIRDVIVLLELLEELGVRVSWEGEVLELNARDLKADVISAARAKKIRASILLAGPLLARRGRAELPPPGGDAIGRRRLDTHVLALEGLGAEVESSPERFVFRSEERLQGADVFLDEASVTATENALMAASLAEGTTVLSNAASEPHVQDLCFLLQAMGCPIEGVGTNRLVIHGQSSLHGALHRLGPDYIEVGSLIALAAVTGSELWIEGARPEEHRATQIAFGRLGVEFRAEGEDLFVPGGQHLKVQPDLGGAIPKIEDAPWPGFPADLTSLAVVTATQAEGTVLIFEKLFESRLFFTDRLALMGARLILCDPHRVVVTGKARLFGSKMSSPDIRAGMALVIAALCAEGQSTIQNIQQVDRGYARIDERLAALGARIERRPGD